MHDYVDALWCCCSMSNLMFDGVFDDIVHQDNDILFAYIPCLVLALSCIFPSHVTVVVVYVTVHSCFS